MTSPLLVPLLRRPVNSAIERAFPCSPFWAFFATPAKGFVGSKIYVSAFFVLRLKIL